MLNGMVAATLALTVHSVGPGPRLPAVSDTASRAVPVGAAVTDTAVRAAPVRSAAAAAAPVGRAAAGETAAPRLMDRFDTAASLELVPALTPTPLSADTPVERVRAVEHSDAYYKRLTIHRIGSYAMLPLFGAEWYLGQRLINTSTSTPPSWVKPTHHAVAYGIYTIFGVNTVTGLWNAWEARHDTDGRARRWIHVASMLVSDAGFVATAATVNQARQTLSGANRHRDLAIGSISLSAASTVFMWLTK